MIVFMNGGWRTEARNQRLCESLWGNEDRTIRGDKILGILILSV